MGFLVENFMKKLITNLFFNIKKILIFILLIIPFTLNAITYYIDPTGSNSNDGSSTHPWLTLAYACAHATSGDIIHVNAGTYALTASVSVPIGINIEGAGITSIFTFNVNSEWAYGFTLNSAMGSNGNQHISNIKMDGLNLSGWAAIQVNGRSNVKIYNCTFVNFYGQGVLFNGAAGYVSSAPGTYPTGNEFHDNIVTNCAYYSAADDYGSGNLMIGGQSAMFIYNNTITQTARGGTVNGYCIKYYSGGYNKGIKIYNNTLTESMTTGPEPANSWQFVLEQWNMRGGFEIYGNNIKGSLDFVNAMKGTYDFAVDVHDNNFGFDTQPPGSDTEGDAAIRFESNFERSNIYKNHFKNSAMSIYVSCGSGFTMRDLYVYYNIFENLGNNLSNHGWALRYTTYTASDVSNTITNWNIWNNVIIGGASNSTAYGIQLPHGIASNFSVRNNIIQGFDQAPIQKGQYGTGSNVSIENNDFYQNGNNNAPSGSIAYTNYTYQNNLTGNPLFISSGDFHLQGLSPCINAGINVGLTTDYAGIAVSNPPEIGVYEYSGGGITAPVITTTSITNITQTTATAGGNVTADGGASVTARGVCWSTSSNPTTANSKTSDGTGTGVFTSSITGLIANTTYHVRAYATNSAGTSYGADVQFTTLVTSVIPTVTTTILTAITQNTATSGGNVTSDGNASVTSRGVCWATTNNPTITNSRTIDGTGTGLYVSSITGLLPNTLYHVCAYATNSVGTAYGNDISFTTLPTPVAPTVLTTSVTNVAQTTATLGGNVTSDGNSPVTARGVCWALTPNPTITNFTTSDGSGTGTYVSSITGLSPNTLYHIRAYATNNIGTSYGNDLTFTTLVVQVLPTVTTITPITNITQTTATAGGNVISDGGANVTIKGICWSTIANPTINDSNVSDGGGTGIYTLNLSALTPNTLYHLRTYATNVVGTAYGADIVFSTLVTPVIPTVTTTIISSIAQTTATAGGNVTSDGNSIVLVKGVCWSTNLNPTTANFTTSDGSGTGLYISALTGLSPNSLYHVRAYATNSAGTGYGNDISFTTLNSPIVVPTVSSTTSVTNIAKTTAISGGSISTDGGASVTARGVCWATTINPTIANSFTNDGTGTGVFISNMTGMTMSTNYHVRAYATNSVGTAYGNDIAFRTDDVPTVVTAGVTNKLQTSVTSGGNVTNDDSIPVTARGVCWSKTINPTVDSLHTIDGAGLGKYVSQITGLTANSRYHVRAYATNAVGTGYGVDYLFTTATNPIVIPIVITGVSSTITWTAQFVFGGTGGSTIKLVCTGNITNTGGSPITAKGICWSTISNPTIANHYAYDNTPNTGTGIFTVNIGVLSPYTLYHIRAFAKNAAGIAYGNDISVTTPDYLIQGN